MILWYLCVTYELLLNLTQLMHDASTSDLNENDFALCTFLGTLFEINLGDVHTFIPILRSYGFSLVTKWLYMDENEQNV